MSYKKLALELCLGLECEKLRDYDPPTYLVRPGDCSRAWTGKTAAGAWKRAWASLYAERNLGWVGVDP